jgi:hypothetical protein
VAQYDDRELDDRELDDRGQDVRGLHDRELRDARASGHRGWIRAASAALAAAALLAALPAGAASDDSKEMATQAGIGAAAGLSSVVYAPLKVAYAAGGSLVAGLAYVLSGGDKDVVSPILDASVRGDYVITPDQITGQRPIEFIGRPPEDRAAARSADADVAAPPQVHEASPKDVGASWR